MSRILLFGCASLLLGWWFYANTGHRGPSPASERGPVDVARTHDQRIVPGLPVFADESELIELLPVHDAPTTALGGLKNGAQSYYDLDDAARARYDELMSEKVTR